MEVTRNTKNKSGGRVLVRGLDERQKKIRERTKNKIFDYISKNEPCSQAMIVRDSGVKDPKVIRNVLTELEKQDKRIAFQKFNYVVPKQRGRIFYFKRPFSDKILGIIGKEELLSKIGIKYYFGVKKDIPLEIQYTHKLSLLNNEYNSLKKLFKKKSENYEKITKITDWENLTLNNLEFFVSVIKKYYILVDDPENSQMCFEYVNGIFPELIEKMDFFYSNFTELKSNSKVAGPIKTIIAGMMIDENKSGVMKKIGMSPKSGSKFEKELFNEDRTPKIKAINEINIKSIGVKEFGPIPSGETLMKKWKETQQDV